MNYSYILHTPEKLIKIDENIALFEEKGEKTYDIAPFSVSKKVTENGIYRIIELTVSSENDAEVYLSLMGEGEAKFFSFQNSPRGRTHLPSKSPRRKALPFQDAEKRRSDGCRRHGRGNSVLYLR